MRSSESPLLNAKSEPDFPLPESLPPVAEIYPVSEKIEKLRIESRPGKRLWNFNGKSFLFLLTSFGLLGWAGISTKNWLQVESNIPALRTSVDRLRQEISLIQGEKAYLRRRGLRLESSLHQKNKKLRDLERNQRTLEREFAYAQQRINSLKSKVQNLSAAPSELLLKPSVQGIIVRINPVYEYAIISLGTEHGIQEGKDLFVVRDGVIKGALRTDQVFGTFSICSVWSKDPGDLLQSGDLVLE